MSVPILTRLDEPAGHRGVVQGMAFRAGRLCRPVVLGAHAWALRRDLAPARLAALDPSDADALVSAWLRQFRRHTAAYPEEALAWKIGAVLLVGLLVGLLVMVSAIR